MNTNHIIPPEKEKQWVAFLNGEPDILDVSSLEEEEMDDLTSVWEAAGNHFSNSAANTELAWLNIQKEVGKQEKKFKLSAFRTTIFKYAAMVVMAIGIGFVTYRIAQSPSKQITISIPMASATTEAHPLNFTVITLPDGSTVKMNASTRIEYPERFSADVRKVKLLGEAFFEVVRDTAHPFIIETTNASVEVLGTSFNVSAYPETGLVEVNVKTGKVKLTQHATGNLPGKSTILPAGEHGWLKVVDGEMGNDMIVSSNYSSWITKEIVFQRTPLSEAFAVLENTYHVKIKMESSEIGRIPYTANFANLKLDYIIDVMARTHKLKVGRIGDEIVFARATK